MDHQEYLQAALVKAEEYAMGLLKKIHTLRAENGVLIENCNLVRTNNEKLRAEISRREALDSESKYQLDKYNAELMREVGNLRAELDAATTQIDQLQWEVKGVAEWQSEYQRVKAELDALERRVQYWRDKAKFSVPSIPDGYELVPADLLDAFPEINTNNYSHDDVWALNAWGVEVVLAAAKNRHDDINVADLIQVVDTADEALLRECLAALDLCDPERVEKLLNKLNTRLGESE